MPHNGLRFREHSRGVLSKEGKVIEKQEPPTIVATSVLLEPDAKIAQPRVEIEGLIDEKTGEIIPTRKKSKSKVDSIKKNVKKEEPTPTSNDVKNDSKE